MKKILVVSLCLAIMGGAYTVAKDNNDTPYINASSTITKDINPNYAEISISIETKNKEADAAAKENAEISTVVVNELKAILDVKKGDTIETVNYNLEPQYQYKEGKSTLTGYMVSNTVKIKMRDIKSVSSVIDVAMNSGANRVSNLTFGYDEEGLLCNELYAKATKNAYSQAQSVAKAIGSEVIGARSINTTCYIEGQSTNFRYHKNMAVGASAMADSSTPIEAKSLKVRATIDGTFNIK